MDSSRHCSPFVEHSFRRLTRLIHQQDALNANAQQKTNSPAESGGSFEKVRSDRRDIDSRAMPSQPRKYMRPPKTRLGRTSMFSCSHLDVCLCFQPRIGCFILRLHLRSLLKSRINRSLSSLRNKISIRSKPHSIVSTIRVKSMIFLHHLNVSGFDNHGTFLRNDPIMVRILNLKSSDCSILSSLFSLFVRIYLHSCMLNYVLLLFLNKRREVIVRHG